MATVEERAAIQKAKVFMVGAGGIGCELLKTLVMSGFEDVELIDMDTIDVSNLNRQFLFRNRHVGLSKAKVAREAALAMRPSARIVAHHGSVMAPEYDVGFFRRFTVVLNGLDNVAARRHVNRMCLAAGVPLVDSGTMGYDGQVTVHLKGKTACYDCEPKPTPKSFPTCTITNTPSKIEHCIVWAKELPFQKLFGDRQQPSDLDAVPHHAAGADAAAAAAADDAATSAEGDEGRKAKRQRVSEKDGENERKGPGKVNAATTDDWAEERKNGERGSRDDESKSSGEGEEPQGGGGGRAEAREGGGGGTEENRAEQGKDFYETKDGESPDVFARRIFDRLFGDNIAHTLRMEDMWRHRKRPNPIYLRNAIPGGGSWNDACNGQEGEVVVSEMGNEGEQEGREEQRANGRVETMTTAVGSDEGSGNVAGSAMEVLGLRDPHSVWNLEENARVFLEAVKIFMTQRKAEIGQLTFDKDDDLAVQFVTAAANVRAHSFGISMQSLFAVKGMAGNIVHAVATTNAIIAGLVVMQATRVVMGRTDDVKFVWARRFVNGLGRFIEAQPADIPLASCHVCSHASFVLELDTQTATLGEVVTKVLKRQIGAAYPTVTVGDALLYEEGADLEPDEVAMYVANAKKTLGEFDPPIREGSILTVEDYVQHFKCDVCVRHRKDIDVEAHTDGMILTRSDGGATTHMGSEAEAKVSGEADGAAAGEDGGGGGSSDDDDNNDEECVEVVNEVFVVEEPRGDVRREDAAAAAAAPAAADAAPAAAAASTTAAATNGGGAPAAGTDDDVAIVAADAASGGAAIDCGVVARQGRKRKGREEDDERKGRGGGLGGDDDLGDVVEVVDLGDD